MRIALYDTEHFETTYTWMRLLDTTEYQITVFTTKDIATILKEMMPDQQARRFNWVILKPAALTNVFRLYRFCKRNGVQFLLLNTVAYHHLLMGLLCSRLTNVKTILTIHDANGFFKPQLHFGFRGILRFTGKKLLARQISAYTTLLSSTKLYIEKTFHTKNPIYVTPGSFFENFTSTNDIVDQHLVIAIPGSVDVKRRDYSILFHALSIWQQQNTTLELVLLGGVADEKNKEVLRTCQSFATDKLKIKVYDASFVSQQEYEFQLRRCDFIYAPLKETFQEDSSTAEVYGLTKSSGSFFDAIRFGKPLLLPSTIHLPSEIAPQTILHHSAEELAEFVISLNLADKEGYKKTATLNSSQFTLAALRKQLPL